MERSPAGASGAHRAGQRHGLRGRPRRRPGLPAQRHHHQRHHRFASPSPRPSTRPWPASSASPRWTPAPGHAAQLQGGPAVPDRRAPLRRAPGPGSAASPTSWPPSRTSATGAVDTVQPAGATADARRPARRIPGPTFELYGPGAKAANDSDFRGFVALDVRNFESTTSRVYYNGVTAGHQRATRSRTWRATTCCPATRDRCSRRSPTRRTRTTRSPSCSATTRPWSSSNFDDVYVVGDRLLLAVYNGTVMQIPDFAITPPSGVHAGIHRRTR